MADQNGGGRRVPGALLAFSLSKEVLVEAAQPVATVALVSTCSALVFTQQTMDSKNKNPHLAVLMDLLLFSYLPFGIAGVLLGVAVKKHTGLVGLTSGFLLLHLLLPTVLGGVLHVVRSGDAWFVGVFTAIISIFKVPARPCVFAWWWTAPPSVTAKRKRAAAD